MHNGKLNSTELDRSVELSWVYFSVVHWTDGELRQRRLVVAGSWQSRTGDGAVAITSRRSSSNDWFFRFTLVKNLQWPPILSPNRRASSQVVAGLMRCWKLNLT